MALKESNKNRSKVRQQAELEQYATCSYITRLIFGGMFVVGIILALVNAFIFPNL